MSHGDVEVRLNFLRVDFCCFYKLRDSLGEEVMGVWELYSFSKKFVVERRFVNFWFWDSGIVLDWLRKLVYFKVAVCKILEDKWLYSHFLALWIAWNLKKNSDSFLRLFFHHCHHSFNQNAINPNLFSLLELKVFYSSYRVVGFVKVSALNV